jgi:ribosomal protein L16 Arg81 hydroxylase
MRPRPPSLSFKAADFHSHYERKPFLIAHDLGEHPLFSFERLADLARRLPEENVELNAGDVPHTLVDGRKPQHGLSPEQTLQRIRECRTWLGLKKVEQVPEYRELIDGILDRLQPLIEARFPRMYRREGFIFVTSPRSTVPFHMDPEHNFLFQIRGGKFFTIFDRSDREVVPEQEIERHYSQENRKLVLEPEHLGRGQRIHLVPGDALHVPINAPHFVENDDEVSVSFSVTFRTRAADRRELVYMLNHKLRRLGVTPTPFGVHPQRDRLKQVSYRAWGLASRARERLLSR